MIIAHQIDIHKKNRIRLLNCGPSKIVPEDVDQEHRARRSITAKFPEKIDLRKGWWDIADQGKTGSCVGWAIADSVLRWHFVEAGRLSKKKYLSARFIWMAAKETDDDTKEPTTFLELAITKIEAGLKIAKIFGVIDEKALPFSPTVLYDDGIAAKFYEKASQFKISEYKSLIGPEEEDLLDSNLVCKWLAADMKKGGGPIVVRMGADRAFINAKRNTPVLEKFNAWQAAQYDDHCAAIVGYYTEGEKMYFILRNSYGKDWGENGYAYLSKEYLEAAVQEAWRVRI